MLLLFDMKVNIAVSCKSLIVGVACGYSGEAKLYAGKFLDCRTPCGNFEHKLYVNTLYSFAYFLVK